MKRRTGRQFSASLTALLLIAACRADVRPTASDNQAAANVAAPISAAPEPEAPAPVPETQRSPCLLQDGKTVGADPIRAIGTEPFWGVRTQGRCVTYSTPEDQAGTRVWAKVARDGPATRWTGALRGKRFELSVQPMPGCSDGMSDTRYPLEARVLVDGEERRGCAEPSGTGR